MSAFFFLLTYILLVSSGCANGSINFIVIGDWGADPSVLDYVRHDELPSRLTFATPEGVSAQHRVRDKMEVWAARYDCQFVLTVGDNFYPNGVVSLDDWRWDVVWKDVYNTTHLQDQVWHATLGNHDHVIDGRYMYQVNRTYVDPYWYMPNNYYDFYRIQDDVKVHFVALDTELITFNLFGDKDIQLAWLNDTLDQAEPSDWTVVYGHHAIRTCGKYAPGNIIMNRDVLPALLDRGVDLYLDGHDHNLQHIVRNDSVRPEYVVSGSGGESLYEFRPLRCRELHEGGHRLEFFAERYGFVGVIITKSNMTVTFYGDEGPEGELEQLYSFTMTKEDF